MMASLKQPPVFNPDGGDTYCKWKNDVQVWCLLSNAKEKSRPKQGPAVYLSLQGDSRETVCSIALKDFSEENGVDLIFEELKTKCILTTKPPEHSAQVSLL